MISDQLYSGVLVADKVRWGRQKPAGPAERGYALPFSPFKKRRRKLPKYLVELSYTAAGSAGVFKDGGSKRRAEAEKLVQSLGGTVECVYFAFGEVDLFAICDLPDNVSAATLALATAGSGAITGKTTVLLTPEEIDAATAKSVSYTPPGQ